MSRFRVRKTKQTELEGLFYLLPKNLQPPRKLWHRVVSRQFVKGDTIFNKIYRSEFRSPDDEAKPLSFPAFLGTYFESQHEILAQHEDLFITLYNELIGIDGSLIQHPEIYVYGFKNKVAQPNDPLYGLVRTICLHATGFHLKVVHHKDQLRPFQYEQLMFLLIDAYEHCPTLRELYDEHDYLAPLLDEVRRLRAEWNRPEIETLIEADQGLFI